MTHSACLLRIIGFSRKAFTMNPKLQVLGNQWSLTINLYNYIESRHPLWTMEYTTDKHHKIISRRLRTNMTILILKRSLPPLGWNMCRHFLSLKSNKNSNTDVFMATFTKYWILSTILCDTRRSRHHLKLDCLFNGFFKFITKIWLTDSPHKESISMSWHQHEFLYILGTYIFHIPFTVTNFQTYQP